MKTYSFKASSDNLTIEEYDEELNEFLSAVLPDNFVVTDYNVSPKNVSFPGECAHCGGLLKEPRTTSIYTVKEADPDELWPSSQFKGITSVEEREVLWEEQVCLHESCREIIRNEMGFMLRLPDYLKFCLMGYRKFGDRFTTSSKRNPFKNLKIVRVTTTIEG